MGKKLASSLSLTHPHTLIPLQERKNNFSGKLGERPWTADFSPEGSACPGGWCLQHGKLPGQPPLALHQGGLCGPACWGEGVASGMQCGPSSHQQATGCHLSSVLSISIRSELRRGRELLYSEPLCPGPAPWRPAHPSVHPCHPCGRCGCLLQQVCSWHLCSHVCFCPRLPFPPRGDRWGG